MANSSGYEFVLRSTTILLGVLVAVIIGELVLRVYATSISEPEQIAPGLIRYHSRYGWQLSPNWRGKHRHIDYEVEYQIDARGLREAAIAEDAGENALAVVVGDSFTFGLGVNNDETFVAQLNQLEADYEFLNAAVPGYSPEQSLLVAEDLVKALQPGLLIYVVYLGNDLVDIGLPFPVQAEQGKPYATIDSGYWQLTNIPVPKRLKPKELSQRSLSSYILKEGWLIETLSSLKTGRLILQSGIIPVADFLNLDAIEKSLTLFDGVLGRVIELRLTTDVQILLIPGSTAINQPGSLAGIYQRMMGDRIAMMVNERHLPLINGLDSGVFPTAAESYYANDGHLTPTGNRDMAAFIYPRLSPPRKLSTD